MSYNNAGLPVPEYLGSDEARLEITMQKLNGRNFWRCILIRKAIGYGYGEESEEAFSLIARAALAMP